MKGVEVYRIRRVIGKGSFLEAHAGTALIARNDPRTWSILHAGSRVSVTAFTDAGLLTCGWPEAVDQTRRSDFQ